MEKLKKLFPLSFKYCGNVKQIILGMFIYVLLDLAVALVISTVLSFITTPLSILMFVGIFVSIIPYVGWVLAIFLIPIALIVSFILTVLSYAQLIITGMASIYIKAGIVTMFVAYAKTPEVESVKKADKAAAPAEETYAEVNEEA